MYRIRCRYGGDVRRASDYAPDGGTARVVDSCNRRIGLEWNMDASIGEPPNTIVVRQGPARVL